MMDPDVEAERLAEFCLQAVDNHGYINERFLHNFCFSELNRVRPERSALKEVSHGEVCKLFHFDPAPMLLGRDAIDLILTETIEPQATAGHAANLVALVELKRDANPILNAWDMIRTRTVLLTACVEPGARLAESPFGVHILLAIDDRDCQPDFERAIAIANKVLQAGPAWELCAVPNVGLHSRKHQPGQATMNYQIYAAVCRLARA